MQVIQRRGQYGNSIFYFYRKWNDYASGFGSTEKEYWIGKKIMFLLAKQRVWNKERRPTTR
ncbi:hypothetical protein HPB48_002389 [Haemaphysalis longicornis]|uniref:Fibrinogen C-terminal domain-containing protein n=1 Tax=Haemaphysalis longicornis TaxID=44386 RepID=A0A9J6H0G4_HAELO|nr:hypothetical protein HPB48_002389 [Haemaphysalis longicornis]